MCIRTRRNINLDLLSGCPENNVTYYRKDNQKLNEGMDSYILYTPG
jgi:hypothetical protein